MIEALIDVRRGGTVGLKVKGDIIVAKLSGAPWGNVEKKFQQIIELDDASLQTQLEDLETAGETYPCIVHPYATYDGDNIMTSRSTKYLDIGALDAGTKANVEDADIYEPKIAEVDTSILTR